MSTILFSKWELEMLSNKKGINPQMSNKRKTKWMNKKEAMRANKIGMKKMTKIKNNNSKRTNRKHKRSSKSNSNSKMMVGSLSKRKNE